MFRTFPFEEMTTLRNKRKLAAVARETQNEFPMNSQSTNTSVPGKEECIMQVSEGIEGRGTEKQYQEFSRTECRIWLLCLNQTELSLIQRYEHTPEPYRERSGTKTWKIRNQRGSFPGWSSFLGETLSLSVPWSHDSIVSDPDGAPQTQSQHTSSAKFSTFTLAIFFYLFFHCICFLLSALFFHVYL